MAEASRTIKTSVDQGLFWKAITGYEAYPGFIDGMKTAKVLSRTDGNIRVQYEIELLGKTVTYTLDHTELSPNEMNWILVESNVMKSNSGGWKFSSSEGSLSVTYRLALEFKIYVPGLILNGLVKNMLPKMMENFEAQAKKLQIQ